MLFVIIQGMNEFKYQLVNFFLLALLGTGIYWAFTTIDNSIIYDKNRILQESEITNSETEKNEISFVDEQEHSSSEKEKEKETNSGDVFPQKENEEVNQERKLSQEEQQLLAKLQGLIDDNIYMKIGSHGTRVGTVQKFLNWYFDTSKKVDNEYGPGTKADVKKFQEKEGLENDGLAGPDTYRKMIEILKK